jgi:hypothetical protein
MLRILLIIFFTGSFLQPLTCDAQGTIVFLNGKERRFEAAEIKGEYLHYSVEGDTMDFKKIVDRYNVFSLKYDNGTEDVLYQPDTAYGEDPSVEEVRDFIKGEQYAMKRYKKPMNFISGVGVGLASSAAGFYGIPIPLAYSTVLGRFNPHVPANEDGSVQSESFKMGYQKKARNMKIKNSLLGGAVGFAVGITALVVIFANE